ncbi:uncharacterized protein LOC101883205 [Anopheles sinensis]|uniref:Uncharacterized protein LOC101883205 n=1 Tax=Anopheles sinensis TaxID=74873 RepID=A0A084VCH4_ANOSI|nr:uncharacterized protein LOC101883205 [Anopheles sinensis]
MSIKLQQTQLELMMLEEAGSVSSLGKAEEWLCATDRCVTGYSGKNGAEIFASTTENPLPTNSAERSPEFLAWRRAKEAGLPAPAMEATKLGNTEGAAHIQRDRRNASDQSRAPQYFAYRPDQQRGTQHPYHRPNQRNSNPPPPGPPHTTRLNIHNTTADSTSATNPCMLCGGTCEALVVCSRFLGASVAARRAFVNERRLCKLCVWLPSFEVRSRGIVWSEWLSNQASQATPRS